MTILRASVTQIADFMDRLYLVKWFGNELVRMNVNKRVNIECSECKNAKCFIKLCSSKYISILNEHKNQINIGKGQYVFQEGSPVFGIYFIQEGKVKVVSSNTEGKEQIVRLAGDGHILGHRGYGGETYPIGAVAVDESRICFLDNNILLDAFKANFNFLYNTMMFYSKELRKCELRARHFAQMSVEEKVIFTLVYIIETFEVSIDNHLLNVTLSRKELADISGTNASQVSRIIANLKEKKLIRTSGNHLFIDNYEGLKKMIEFHLSDSFL